MVKTTMTQTTCPMFGEICQYCSMEQTTRPFTKLVKNPKTRLFEPAGLGKITTNVGEFCNNHPVGKTGWVAEMHYCPARWGLRRGVVKPTVKKKKKAAIKKKPTRKKSK